MRKFATSASVKVAALLVCTALIPAPASAGLSATTHVTQSPVDPTRDTRPAHAAGADCPSAARAAINYLRWLSICGSPAPSRAIDVPLGIDAAANVAAPQPLPPAPSSARLAVVGLAVFGVWGVGRSARNLHLSHLPDWYHTDGPAQVGHATPFELDRSLWSVCKFDTPLTAHDRPPARTRSEPLQLVESRLGLLTADPRGPPRA